MNIQLLVFAMMVALAAPGTGTGSVGLGGLLGGAITLVNSNLKALNLNGAGNNAKLPILSNNANNLSISNILIVAGNSGYATPATTTSTPATTTTEETATSTVGTSSIPEDPTPTPEDTTSSDTTSSDYTTYTPNTTPYMSTPHYE